MKAAVTGLIIGALARLAGAQSEPDIEALVAAAQEVEAPAEIDQNDVEVQAASEVVRGARAATITKGVAVRYPYGQSQPTLTCAPLHACALELQAGEEILGVALGDSERWITATLEGVRPLLVVKPTGWDLATNMVVSTNRRAYHVGLKAPKEGASVSYDRVVGWWYPEEIVRVYSRLEQQQAADREVRAGATSETLAIPLEAIDQGRYSIKGDRVSWRPEMVIDDGRRTFVRFPEGIGAKSAPALLVESDTGEAALANHRVLPGGRWWVIDGVFPALRFQQGAGRKAKEVIARNGSWQR
jgi:type IV secretion system protein VirB9